MRQNNTEVERYRVKGGTLASDKSFGNNGAFGIPYGNEHGLLAVVIHDGEGWDHVSVSLPDRCATWDEMCYIKDVFFEPEETVIQFHPPKSGYVDDHKFCLHLWRNQKHKTPMPPKIFVGQNQKGVV